MRDLVFEALDNAAGSGYDQRDVDPAEIARDLTDACSDFEDVEPEALIPHVKAWQDAVRNGR
jgi:hypothetical protein